VSSKAAVIHTLLGNFIITFLLIRLRYIYLESDKKYSHTLAGESKFATYMNYVLDVMILMGTRRDNLT